MTWVEGLMLLCVVGAVGGYLQRLTARGRAVMWVSLVTLVLLLARFGAEFVADLL
jgi:hypothetical protein